MAKRKITHQYFGDDDDQSEQQPPARAKSVEPQAEPELVEEVAVPLAAPLQTLPKQRKVVHLRSTSDSEDDEPHAGPSSVRLPYAGPTSTASPKSKKAKRKHLRGDDDELKRKRLEEAHRLEEGRMKLPFWEGVSIEFDSSAC